MSSSKRSRLLKLPRGGQTAYGLTLHAKCQAAANTGREASQNGLHMFEESLHPQRTLIFNKTDS